MFLGSESRYRIGTVLCLTAVFVPTCLRRFVDGDEGYLLYAARLLTEGKLLYRDFFFPQAPLIPNLFALLFRIAGPSWYSARLLAAALAVLSGYFVYRLACHYTRSPRWGAVAAFLFAACGYTLGWIPIAKTYGLALACSLAATWTLVQGKRHAAIVSGFLIALASGARLYMGVLGLNAIVYCLKRQPCARDRISVVLELAVGAALGYSFFVPPFVRDFESAFFGVFEFVSMRFPEQTTLFGPLSQKLGVLLSELSLRGADGSGSTQMLGLVVLGLAALFHRGWTDNRLTASVWPTLLVVNLLPYNTFSQYVCVVVPFIAVEAVVALALFTSSTAILRALLPGLALYGLLGAFDFHRFTTSGQGLIGVDPNPEAWRLEQVVRVGKEVDGYHVEGVVSWWPGYFVSTRTHVIPQLANHFAFHVTGRLDASRRSKLVLISEPELYASIIASQYPLVVVGNWVAANWDEALVRGYRLDRIVGNARLWIRH